MIYLILYPYLELIILIGIIFRNISANGFIYEVDNPLIIALEILLLIVPYIVALITSIIAGNKATYKKNMIIKLSHILFYILVFILGVAMALTVFGLPISICCIVADIAAIIPSGIYMCRLKNVSIIQKLCGFIFVVDVIMSIYIYTHKKNEIEW